MKYTLIILVFFFAFSCSKEIKNTTQKKIRVIDFYFNHTYIDKKNKSRYIFSEGYPFGVTLQPKNIYIAKIDSNENVIYEFRTLNSNRLLSLRGDTINNNLFPYYMNIFNGDKCNSFFVGDYTIDGYTYIDDIDSIYLNNKGKFTPLCCNSKKEDWEHTGAKIMTVDSCHLQKNEKK